MAAVLVGGAACTAAPEPKQDGPAPKRADSAPARLRDGLLTADRLPPGFTLNTSATESTTTRAPRAGAAAAEPLESMSCSELGVSSFLTTHAPPLEDVAVGLERTPVGAEDLGWGGQQALDRYPAGQAAAVLDAVRLAAGRCASFSTTLIDGSQIQEFATATQVGDSLRLRVTSTGPSGSTGEWVDETAFLRVGDVILSVQEVVTDQPGTEVQTLFAAAEATYRERLH
ncbi:hypothetical protein BX266_2339 [Streptomyces sp. TLI_171]|nr:hypothetical protein BX266_2339 [Streptomyces sp. TLI_171]